VVAAPRLKNTFVVAPLPPVACTPRMRSPGTGGHGAAVAAVAARARPATGRKRFLRKDFIENSREVGFSFLAEVPRDEVPSN
jgi:hypothetical protein